MKLSIIVPIYNAAPYLTVTIESLLSQNLREDEYEIILIDDGSTDDSWHICKKYAAQYSSIIRIFTKNNEGVSITRNLGLNKARGNYVYFMDADDFLIPSGFRYLIDTFWDNNIDVLTFSSTTINFDVHGDLDSHNTDIVEGQISFEGRGRDFYKKQYFTFVWTHFYRRSFLTEHNLLFENVVMIEDTLFNLKVHLANPLIRNVTSNLYRYCTHEGALTKKRDYTSMRRSVEAYTYLLTTIAVQVDFYKDRDEDLANGLRSMILSQFTPFVSRLLSSDYSICEMKDVKETLLDNHVLPIDNGEKVIFNVFNYPILFPIFKFLYQRIFIPYVLPRLSRN